MSNATQFRPAVVIFIGSDDESFQWLAKATFDATGAQLLVEPISSYQPSKLVGVADPMAERSRAVGAVVGELLSRMARATPSEPIEPLKRVK